MIAETATGMQTASPDVDPSEVEFQKLKTAVHEELIESLDLSVLGEMDHDLLVAEISRLAQEICRERGKQLSEEGLERLVRGLSDEIFGLGPLEDLMKDATISDILVNGPHEVFVERGGRLERANVVFADEQHLMRIIQRVVTKVGRRIDEVSSHGRRPASRRIPRQRDYSALGARRT